MCAAKHIGFLVKPASSACNMRCRYCFYSDVAAHRVRPCARVMDDAVTDALIDRALAVAPDAHVSFSFQGGEPTLAGLPYFRSFIERVEARREHQQVSYALQTNGLAIDDAWAAFLAEHRVLCGVSIDGWRDLHDSLRPDAHGAGTYARAMGAVRRLRRAGAEVNVLAVLTAQMARHPQRMFSWIEREHIDYLQLIPCLPGLDEEVDTFSLTPRAFASFYQRLFDLWWRSCEQGRYVSIWLFENLMQMALGQFPAQCGMLGRCAPQFVVESDGAVYPCDFYALDEWRVGNICTDGLERMATCETMRAFLAEPRRACAACADCPFEGVCHRNCKRLNVAYYDAAYCGLKEFLTYAWPGLERTAHMVARW